MIANLIHSMVYSPGANMPQDALDDLRVVDMRHDAHLVLALGTQQRINLPALLDQLAPRSRRNAPRSKRTMLDDFNHRACGAPHPCCAAAADSQAASSARFLRSPRILLGGDMGQSQSDSDAPHPPHESLPRACARVERRSQETGCFLIETISARLSTRWREDQRWTPARSCGQLRVACTHAR